MRSPRFALLGSLLLLGACDLYFGGGDDCPYGGGNGGGAAVPVQGQRNPETGVCEFLGGNPQPCDSRCGPCIQNAGSADQGAAIAMPTWGYCQSQCTGLDEQTCLATPACRGIYQGVNGGIDCAPGAPGCGAPVFSECWSTDMNFTETGACVGLDAFACSTHDNCIAIHQATCDAAGTCTIGSFSACGDEPGDVNPGTCYDAVTCGSAPPLCGPGATPGILNGCYSGACLPLDKCEPTTGHCYDPVTCGSAPPLCGPGATPGIANGCYTGTCIPLGQCEPPPSCESIADEATCVGRADCAPIYQGQNCTCQGDACTCTDWLYQSCVTVAQPL